MHEWFRRTPLDRHSERSFCVVLGLSFVSISTAPNDVVFILFYFCSSVYEQSQRCVHPCVVFKSDWECVIYTLESFWRNSLLFETNLIYLFFFSSRSSSSSLALVFVVHPAKTFQYSFVPRTQHEKTFRFFSPEPNCYTPNAVDVATVSHTHLAQYISLSFKFRFRCDRREMRNEPGPADDADRMKRLNAD